MPVSRELGALRPLGRSLPKDELEEPLLSAPVSEEPDFELFDEDEDEDEPLPVSDEADFDELFEDEAEEPEELADSTPSDFAVSESSWPVAFKLLEL